MRQVFVPDPAGVSKAAVPRRIEALLSSALRHGTTKHLLPYHPSDFGWVEGDDINNIRLMLEATVKGVLKSVGKAKDLEYDFEGGEFVDTNVKGDHDEHVQQDDMGGTGELSRAEAFTEQGFEKLAADSFKRGGSRVSGEDEGASGKGSTTIQRAVLAYSILRASRKADGREILASFEQKLSTAWLAPAHQRIYYQSAKSKRLNLTGSAALFRREHNHDFSKIAVVTDDQWITWQAWLSRIFIDADIEVFKDYDEALAWVIA